MQNMSDRILHLKLMRRNEKKLRKVWKKRKRKDISRNNLSRMLRKEQSK